MYCVFHHIYGQFQGKFCKTWEWPTSLLEHLVTLKIVKRRHPPFLWKSITKGFISLLMSTHLRQASPLILHSFLSKWPYIFFAIFCHQHIVLDWLGVPPVFPLHASPHTFCYSGLGRWENEMSEYNNLLLLPPRRRILSSKVVWRKYQNMPHKWPKSG